MASLSVCDTPFLGFLLKYSITLLAIGSEKMKPPKLAGLLQCYCLAPETRQRENFLDTIQRNLTFSFIFIVVTVRL